MVIIFYAYVCMYVAPMNLWFQKKNVFDSKATGWDWRDPGRQVILMVCHIPYKIYIALSVMIIIIRSKVSVMMHSVSLYGHYVIENRYFMSSPLELSSLKDCHQLWWVTHTILQVSCLWTKAQKWPMASNYLRSIKTKTMHYQVGCIPEMNLFSFHIRLLVQWMDYCNSVMTLCNRSVCVCVHYIIHSHETVQILLQPLPSLCEHLRVRQRL